MVGFELEVDQSAEQADEEIAHGEEDYDREQEHLSNRDPMVVVMPDTFVDASQRAQRAAMLEAVFQFFQEDQKRVVMLAHQEKVSVERDDDGRGDDHEEPDRA